MYDEKKFEDDISVGCAYTGKKENHSRGQVQSGGNFEVKSPEITCHFCQERGQFC